VPKESGVTVRELLPQALAGVEQTMLNGLAQDSPSGNPSLPGFARQIAASEATAVIQKSLDCDVFSLLARGWGLARELKSYTDRSRYPPGTTSVVYLGEHSVTTEVHPVLTLVIGSIECRPLRFTVVLKGHFRSAALVIRDGCITGLDSGDCSVSAQLKYGEVPLHKEAESRHVILPGHLVFSPPGVIIGAEEPPIPAATP
jgi:hypothetical protein